MTQQEGTVCVLRLFGAPSTAVKTVVEKFPPQWQAAAQWKSRGAETLVALQAQDSWGLKKAAHALQRNFSADLYGAGETTLTVAVVDALERYDRLLVCGDAEAGALLEERLGTVAGADKVFDFGALSYAHSRTGPLLERRTQARLPRDCKDPVRAAVIRTQTARRLVGTDLAVGCVRQEKDSVLVLSSRKGCWLRTVPAEENPALWLLDMIRRAALGKPQAEGTEFRTSRQAAKGEMPGAAPQKHPFRRAVLILLLAMALMCLGAALWYTGGDLAALPERLRSLGTVPLPSPGAKLV